MEIRLTRHDPTGVVALSLAREGDELPRDVRLVDAGVADAVEDLVLRGALDATAVDLDDVMERAVTTTRPAIG